MEWTYAPPTEPWLSILHEDRDLLVLNKPSGLLSVPGRDPAHRDSAYARALERFPLAQAVHRLDMDTSGILVIALRRKAERALHAQFRDRTVTKTYLARVAGHLAEDSGIIDLPLARETGIPRSRIDPEGGKPARTQFAVVGRDADGTTRVELVPLTGRSHQLRLHLVALGHPILGDRFYAPAEVRDASARLCLHAWRLGLDHPYRGDRMNFEAAVPF